MKFVVPSALLILFLLSVQSRADSDDDEYDAAAPSLDSDSPPVLHWYRNPTFYNLMMLQVSFMIVSKPQTPLLGAKAALNGISTESMGAVLAMMPLSSALFGPIVGQQLPRIGMRRAVALGVVLMSGSGAAFAVLDLVRGPLFVAIAIALRLLFGLGQAAIATPTSAYWNTAFDNFSTVHSVSSTAAIIVGMLVPVVCAALASYYGYSVSLLAFGALSALIGAGCTSALPEGLPVPSGDDGGNMLGLVRTVPQITPVLMVLVANMAMSGLIGLLVPFVFAAIGVSEVAISAVFSVSAACWAGGMHLSSLMLDKLHHRPNSIMLIATLLSIVAVGMMATFRSPAPLIAAVGLLALSTSVAQMASAFVLVTETRRYNEGLVSLTSGLKHAARTGGEALGLVIGGVLNHRLSLQMTAAVFSAFSAGVLCVFVICNFFLKRRPEEIPLPQSVPSTPLSPSESLLSEPLLEKGPSPSPVNILLRLFRRVFKYVDRLF